MEPKDRLQPPPPSSPPHSLHQDDADEEDENVKQLKECSALYLSLQECLVNSNRNWKSCQVEVQTLKACHEKKKKQNQNKFNFSVFTYVPSAQDLSNGRFKNADHQTVVNSNYSCLSIATFQNPAPDATVYPLKIREGEKSILDEPMTFAEMYRKKMSKDIELAKLKKLAKEKLLQELEKPNLEEVKSKALDDILA